MNIDTKNNLFIISGPPASGKSTLILNTNKLKQIINIQDRLEDYRIGVENNYKQLLNDKNIINLIYHYNILTEKSLFWEFKRIEKLIKQFKNITIIICACKRFDLEQRNINREIAKKRKISLKTINPIFIYTIHKILQTYKNREKLLSLYEIWLNYLSNIKCNYIIYNTTKDVYYPIKAEEIRYKLNDII